MYRKGHYGVALLVFSPVAFVLVALGEVTLAVLAGAAMLWLAMLPDVDLHLPGVSHRGVTHTLGFAALVGVALGAAGRLTAPQLGLSEADAFAFCAFVGVLSVVSHILADALTPMGVRPLWPLLDRHVTLGLTPADSPVWNLLLLGVGAGVAVAAVSLALSGSWTFT